MPGSAHPDSESIATTQSDVLAHVTLEIIAGGWNGYQAPLSAALAPLTPAQLALRTASKSRSIEELARVITARSGRFDTNLRAEHVFQH